RDAKIECRIRQPINSPFPIPQTSAFDYLPCLLLFLLGRLGILHVKHQPAKFFVRESPQQFLDPLANLVNGLLARPLAARTTHRHPPSPAPLHAWPGIPVPPFPTPPDPRPKSGVRLPLSPASRSSQRH